MQHGHVRETEDFLYLEPADILMMTKDGMSLAAIAAKYGQAKILKMLAQRMEERNLSFDTQYKGKHLMVAAMESRDIDTIDAVCFRAIP